MMTISHVTAVIATPNKSFATHFTGKFMDTLLMYRKDVLLDVMICAKTFATQITLVFFLIVNDEMHL
jgi:hypothetical protein